MRKVLLPLVLLVCTCTAFAQNASDIAGIWKFKDIVITKEMDARTVEMLTGYFAATSFDFNPNGKYLAALMGNADTGSWALADKTIELTSDKGEVYKLNIVDYKKDFLSVKLKSAAFTLYKVSASELKSDGMSIGDSASYITVTKDQLCKKWFLKQSGSKRELSAEMKEAMQKMMKGSFLQFDKDGKYSAEVVGITDEGMWQFGEDKRSIVTTNGTDKSFWNVIKITNYELIMVKGNSSEQWIFSTEP